MRKPTAAVVRTGAIIVLAWLANGVSAQEWTFERIAQQVVVTHPAVRARHSAASAARADVDAAEWQRYPTPTLEAGAADSGGPSNAFRVQQPLWAGGRIDAGIDAARYRSQAAEMAIDESRDELLQRVVAAYVEAVRQQERQDYAVRSVKEHERLLALITRRVDAEASPSVDRDLARSRLYQAMNDLSAINQALRAALTQLSQLAGATVGKVATVQAETAALPGSRDAALQQAIARSPTLARLAAEEAAAGADITVRKATYQPQLALRYEHTRNSLLSDQRVLLVLEAQPGAGFSAGANVDAAVARKEAARLARDSALLDLQERVAVDWDQLVAARLRLENATLARSTSTEVFESYSRQYTTGRKTWLDVLNAVREAAQSELTVADTTAQLAAAALRLRLVTGGLLAARTERAN